ncbi:MAG: DegT/DnrJ/EryC1/StrS family aminotransferase [Cyclobacteriaceae bacterium]|nr:DegT/DnrJ/EryC1/StrS family aminotransferase [Cyclobacteriaceae bacterium]
MMSVPFCSLKYAHDQIKYEAEKAMEGVYRRGQFILGTELEAFEHELATYGGTQYCIGVANGLDALYLSLHLLGIGPGDEVIVPAHTYIASWLAITRTGAKVVPVDANSGNMLMDTSLVTAAITGNTKAIMPVHLYGAACDMSQLTAIAKENNLYIVEDNAQAHGATWKEKKTGSFGDCNATSFYPTKNLGALGDGGAITTDSKALAESAFSLRNYGSTDRFTNPVVGINSRLDELQAAVLRVKLKYLDEWNELRRVIAQSYLKQLKGVGDIILPTASYASVYHLFVIRTQYREELRSFLFQKGIGTTVHYPIPPHLQGAYDSMSFKKGVFPVSEKLAESVLSLPMWPGLEEEQVNWVVKQIKKFFEGK